jgi:hypothetical protein
MASSDAEFYKDPANIEAGRRVTPTTRAPMTGHVPVRFSESVITRVKSLALEDGVTVSTWIRNLVLKELERRTMPTTGSSVLFDTTWVKFSESPDLWVSSPTIRIQESDVSEAS